MQIEITWNGLCATTWGGHSALYRPSAASPHYNSAFSGAAMQKIECILKWIDNFISHSAVRAVEGHLCAIGINELDMKHAPFCGFANDQSKINHAFEYRQTDYYVGALRALLHG